jgi:ligand-binding sensor domain-containing protein
MKLFSFGLFILFGNSFFSQKLLEGNFNFKNYSIDQGLPSSETYDIEQDNEGNIWIATDRGVVKYNSRTFKTFTKKDGLIDDVVLQIYKDPFGRLWFLTIENQLCYYEKGKIKKYRYNYLIRKKIPESTQPDKELLVTKSNSLIISTIPYGTFVINSKGKISRKQQPKEGLKITLYNQKLFWSINLKQKWSHFPKPKIYYSTLKKEKFILQEENPQCKILVSGNKFTPYLLINNRIYNLKTSKKIIEYKNSTLITLNNIDSEIWVGKLNEGIDIFDSKNHFKRNIFNGFSVTNVFKDKTNGFWFSTLENGIFYISNLEIENYTKKNGLLSNEIKSIYYFKDTLFLSFSGSSFQKLNNNYLFNFNSEGKGFTSFSSFNNELIFSNFNGTYKNYKLIYPYWFRDFFSSSNYCLGIREKIMKFSKNVEIENISEWAANNRKTYTTITKDNQNTIWIGNQNGLFKLIDNKITPFRPKEFHFKVTDLIYSKKKGLLIGTRDNGLFQFKNNTFKKIKGLLTNDITTLYEENETGKIWVGTTKGINISNSQLTKFYCISNFNGLISNEITSINIQKKIGWIGTKKGLYKIDLSKYHFINVKNKVNLTSVIIDNKKIKLQKELSIPYDKDILKINFGTINFNTKGKFKYRLHPISNWTTVEQPQILLFNPEDGNYKLEVAFLNENNRWSRVQNILNFKIEPPFWRTIYFKICILLSISVVIYLFFRFKQKQFETKQKLLILEQKALFAQMNPHFIFNTLNSIQSFLIYNENEKAEFFLSKFSKLLRETLHISRNSNISLKKEIEILEKYLDLEQMRFSNKFNWEIINNISIDQNIRIPNMLIQPYIENSIKHGFIENRFDYKIEIIISQLNEHTLTCEIIDNGIGRENSILKKDKIENDHISYGEKITKERLKSYNKSKKIIYKTVFHDITNEFGNSKGSKVEIIIPILKQ